MAVDVDEPRGLTVDVVREGTSVIAALSGELDIATRTRLERSLPRVDAGDRLVLDLRRLTFIDSSGIRLLMELDVRSRADGWSFAIVRGLGTVQRVLDLCSVGDRVLCVDDPADAL
jgi:anti-sigma B factor antagonist